MNIDNAGICKRPRPESKCNGCIHKTLHRNYDKMVVSMCDLEEKPTFRQGSPSHELEEPVTADLCIFWVSEISRLENIINATTKQERVPFGFYCLSYFDKDGEYTKNEFIVAIDGKVPEHINPMRVILPLYKD